MLTKTRCSARCKPLRYKTREINVAHLQVEFCQEINSLLSEHAIRPKKATSPCSRVSGETQPFDTVFNWMRTQGSLN